MKITKKNIIELINSDLKNQIDEMARGAEEKSLKKERARVQISLFKKKNSDEIQVIDKYIKKTKDPDIDPNFKPKVVGWVLGGAMGTQRIIYTCSIDINSWMSNPDNKKILEKIQELEGFKEGGLYYSKRDCPASYHRKASHKIEPIPGFEPKTDDGRFEMSYDTSFKGAKTHYDQQTWILRGGSRNNNTYLGINGLIKKYLSNSEINRKLTTKLLIPQIRVEIQERSNLGTFKTGIVSNDEIDYTLMNFNSFETFEEFKTTVKKAFAGKLSDKEIKKLEYHIARLSNKFYKNWEEELKNIKDYKGKTDVYKLDKIGLEQKNVDITIKTTLNIKGTRENNTFIWTVTFLTKFGKKTTEQIRIKDGLKPDEDLVVTKVANIPEGTVFDDNNPIIFNDEIYNALNSALEEMGQKIMSIKPISRLTLITPTQGELDVIGGN